MRPTHVPKNVLINPTHRELQAALQRAIRETEARLNAPQGTLPAFRPEDGLIQPAVTPALLDALVLAMVLHDPEAATAIQHGYTFRWWHADLRNLACDTPLPTDPEARWILQTVRPGGFQFLAEPQATARLFHRLVTEYPAERQRALAAPLAAWLDKTPYLPPEWQRTRF